VCCFLAPARDTRLCSRSRRSSDDDDEDDEEEEDDDEEEEDQGGAQQGANGVALDPGAFGAILDEVLGLTPTSPQPKAPAPAAAAAAASAPRGGAMEMYYGAMDAQLDGAAVRTGYDRSTQAGGPNEDEEEDEEGTPTPINMDMNLVRNLLQSFAAQEAMDGPATTLLSSLRLPLPGGDLASIPGVDASGTVRSDPSAGAPRDGSV
jgi:hypothetical protein